MGPLVTDPNATEYIHNHYKAFNPMLQELRTYGENNNVPIILKETEMVLETLLLLKKPKRILEIGTAIGYSALYFASVMPEAKIWTIEKDYDMAEKAAENIERAGLSWRIHVIVGDGEEGVNQLAKEGVSDIDLLFLDAAKSHYKRFLDASLKLLCDEALICSDNIMQHGMTVSDEALLKRKHRTNIRSMRNYVDYIFQDEKFSTSLTAIGDGFAMSIYHRERD